MKEGTLMKTSNLFPSPPRVAVYSRYGDLPQAGGISGEQGLMAACRAGKYDQVLVKNHRHLARNAQDLLRLTREIRDCGTAIRFEREGLVV